MSVRTGDLVICAELATTVLKPLAGADWTRRAGDLDWSCRRTLDHMVDTMLLYGSYVAIQARERRQPIRDGQESASIPDLIAAVAASASMLDLICTASPPPVRAFHPSGLSDADGFRAMGCSELLTHTWDIARGFGIPFTAPFDLCDRINDRVFPWAPDADEHADRWEALLWACGRIALPSRERLDELWWWHSAPIDEWDGTRTQRTAPPAWS